MQWRIGLCLMFISVGLTLIPCVAVAWRDAAPKKLGEYGAWAAYEIKQGAHSTCYMTARPIRSDYKVPNHVSIKNTPRKDGDRPLASPRRSSVILMVAFRPEESMNPVVSYRSGYGFKQSSEVSLKAGEQSFNLFTDKDQAWARSAAIDIQITNALRKVKRLIIQGASNEGGESKDMFDTQGAESAYRAIVKACGIA